MDSRRLALEFHLSTLDSRLSPLTSHLSPLDSHALQLVATAAFGLEAVVMRELEQLGYAGRVARPGRIEFAGDMSALCRTTCGCAVRSGTRATGQVPATDFDVLFETARGLPWEEWIASDAEIPVRVDRTSRG